MNKKVVIIHSDITGMNLWFVRDCSIDPDSVITAFEKYLEIVEEDCDKAINYLKEFNDRTGIKMICDEDEFDKLIDMLEDDRLESIEIVRRVHWRF